MASKKFPLQRAQTALDRLMYGGDGDSEVCLLGDYIQALEHVVAPQKKRVLAEYDRLRRERARSQRDDEDAW